MKKLLDISDLNKDDFKQIIQNSILIKPNIENCLINKNVGLIFEKNSTRTRLSFQVGITQLGGNFIDIRLEDLNLQRIESFEDTFEIMSCYLDALVFRTTSHNKLKLALEYFRKPIINALSDKSHPCQAISDFYTLMDHFQRDDHFNIVWLGDLNNVLFSLLETLLFFDNSVINIFTEKKIYDENISNFPISDKIIYNFELDDSIIKNADCIMTDVYNSMNDKVDKEKILKKFQVNKTLIKKTSDSVVFMHCLPAKIGSEVTEDVIRSSKSITTKQAKNRMIAQRGILKWLNI